MILKYDVIVIGGGHAGCEAACASANMGAKTCLVTMDMNKIAQMSCNPAVGGIAKGQIVREIDALGGQMGLVTDATSIQFRMLNVGKGPAVWSPRAQCDRGKFIWEWRRRLDETENLDVWQDQADELLVEEVTAAQPLGSAASLVEERTKRAVGVRTIWGAEIYAKCVIVTAGTFLNGLMHIGRKMVPGGRIAEPAVAHFTESITRHGVNSARMKTGTPVRIDKRSVHFDEMEIQPGENRPYQFSYMDQGGALKQLPCWTVNTNAEVHEVLRSGLADSPLYNGQIQSRHLPRQGKAPIVLGTRRRRHQRNVPERLFIFPADGSTDRSPEEDTRLPRPEGISAWLCDRVRFLRPDTTQPLVGIEDYRESVYGGAGEWNNGL